MAGHSLSCTVCNGEYFSKLEWLRHLTGESHQILARKECLEGWRKEYGVMDECLVIFTSFGMNGRTVDRLVERLSRRASTFVTEFVWWEDRPRVGVVRFDSRKKVNEILAGLGESLVVTISEDDKARVRKATDLCDFEWNAILPVDMCKKEQLENVTVSVSLATQVDAGVQTEATSCTETDDELPVQLENQFSALVGVKRTFYEPEPDSTTATDVINGREHGKKRKPNNVESADAIEQRTNSSAPGPSLVETPKDDDNNSRRPVSKQSDSNSINYLSSLMELAQRKKWRNPQFHFSIVSKNPDRFLCSVVVNGFEFEPDKSIIPAFTKQQAKHDIARFCYDVLTAGKSKSNGTFSSSDVLKKLSLPKAMTVTSLDSQFNCIRNLVTVPEPEYSKIIKTASDLKAIFLKNDSSADVAIFRNAHFRLRLPTCDTDNNYEPFIYVYNSRSPPEHPQSFSWIPDTIVNSVLGSADGMKQFTILESLEDSTRFDPNIQQFSWKVQHFSTGVIFRMVLFKRFMAEVQICRLAKYLFSFDSRCLPLLTLFYYWSTVNNIDVEGGDPNRRKHSHRVLPERLTLEWLVIHFLCHRQIIPTPRQVQQRPHSVLKERLTGFDVGFRASDANYIEEWKSKTGSFKYDDKSIDEFHLSVLQLFQEFLLYYGEELSKSNTNWILNTRDGETINSRLLINGKLGTSLWFTTLTKKELASLRELQHSKKVASNRNNNHAENTSSPTTVSTAPIDFNQWKIYMTHPFICTWRFFISKDLEKMRKLMKKSGLKLQSFLITRNEEGSFGAWKKFGMLENVLKLVD